MHAGDAHDFTEAACLDLDGFFPQCGAEMLIKDLGFFVSGGIGPGWPATLSRIGVESKLRNDEKGASRVLNRKIHLLLGVHEYPEARKLVRKVFGIGRRIAFPHTKKYKKAMANAASQHSRFARNNRNRSAGYALNYSPHGKEPSAAWLSCPSAACNDSNCARSAVNSSSERASTL